MVCLGGKHPNYCQPVMVPVMPSMHKACKCKNLLYTVTGYCNCLVYFTTFLSLGSHLNHIDTFASTAASFESHSDHKQF